MKPSFDTGCTGNGRKVRNFQINPKKINAARASHPGSTARGCLNLPFTAQGSEVCAFKSCIPERMLVSPRTLRKTSDSVLLSKEDSLRRPQRPGFPNRAEARF